MIWTLRYCLDEAATALLILGAASWMAYWVRHKYGARLWKMWVVWLGLGMALSMIGVAHWRGVAEKRRMQQTLSAIAPIFSTTMEEDGHDTITLSTPADDAKYLELIALEKTWLRASPEIADVYTIRRTADGTTVLCVDSETDYNHDGKFEGDREQRTTIGEPYSNATLAPVLNAAFDGAAGFCDDIYSDRWGNWVSAVQPIHGKGGRVDAVLGVDFPAEQWISSILLTRSSFLAVGLTLACIVLGTGQLIVVRQHEAVMRVEHEQTARAARDAEARTLELERLVKQRTAELEAERGRDGIRMNKLEELVSARTKELRHAALHDKLTGLPNRALFFDRLHVAIQRVAEDPGYSFAVLFIDIDQFKVINDSLGHDAGDKLLLTIGQRLVSALSIEDAIEFGVNVDNRGSLAARLGGDEFSILIEPLKTPEDATEIANRLLEALTKPYQIAGREVNSGASIGITLSSIGYNSAEDAIRDADLAMYRAKSAGRGRFAMFKPLMHEEAMKRLVFENDLRRAMERNELELFFQPIVCLASGAVQGAEALMRWNHRERGLVSPGEFIPLAEETGQIVEIGAWALEQACRMLNEFDGVNAPRLAYLSVNVSRRQMMEPNFLQMFDQTLERTNVDPRRLVLELTESALTHDAALAERTLTAVRERGARVYIDDFGTGLSSLGSIRRFPLDGMKLDRSFLDPAISSRRSAAVIHSAITLGRDLGMTLIAEGVEALDQVALLQAMQCELAQGYLFARPMQVDRLREMLSAQWTKAVAA